MLGSGICLYDTLSNPLILLKVTPLLSLSSLFALAGTSKAFHALIWKTPLVFRRLDLRVLRKDPKRHKLGHPDETSIVYCWKTLHECSTQFKKWNALESVSILILDGLAVPQDWLTNFLLGEPNNVRLLSIRELRDFHPEDVKKLLISLIAASRAGISKIKGVYYFGLKDDLTDRNEFTTASPRGHVPTTGVIYISSTGVMSSPGAQLGAPAPIPNDGGNLPSSRVGWYDGAGKLPFTRLRSAYQLRRWAELLHSSVGVVAFDIVSCRRCPMTAEGKEKIPELATVSLKGCQICGSCPEGIAYAGKSPASHLPLIAPVPLYSSNVRVAQIPPMETTTVPPLIARCSKCLEDRWCVNCNAWWCESCYTPPRKGLSQAENMQSKQSGGSIKVHYGVCVENCLVSELYSGAGEGGMWG